MKHNRINLVLYLFLAVIIAGCKSFTKWSYKDRPTPKIVVINGNNLDEERLAIMLIEIEKRDPAVIGINLKHIDPLELTNKLSDTLSFTDVIIASDSNQYNVQNTFSFGSTDFLEKNKMVRKYYLFKKKNGVVVSSFTQKVASAYLNYSDPVKLDFKNHKIYYGGDCDAFYTINPKDINNSVDELFKDMIVVVGDLGPDYQIAKCGLIKSEKYLTPLLDVSEMNGTIIIANTIYSAVEHYQTTIK
jgi:hypothetical protein